MLFILLSLSSLFKRALRKECFIWKQTNSLNLTFKPRLRQKKKKAVVWIETCYYNFAPRLWFATRITMGENVFCVSRGGCSNTGASGYKLNRKLLLSHQYLNFMTQRLFQCFQQHMFLHHNTEHRSDRQKAKRIKDFSFPLCTWLKLQLNKYPSVFVLLLFTDLITADTKSAETRWGFSSAPPLPLWPVSHIKRELKWEMRDGAMMGNRKQEGVQSAAAADEPHRSLFTCSCRRKHQQGLGDLAGKVLTTKTDK